MIIDHHDGGGLNELCHITCDARDPNAGGASHNYTLTLDLAPAASEWRNTPGECPDCCEYDCLQSSIPALTSAAPFGGAGAWARCRACGSTWTPNGQHHITEIVGKLQFQHGARHLPGSTPGLLDGAVIAVLLDRFRAFQAGPFGCRENAIVITKLEEALMWIQRRTHLRLAQAVLGTNAKHEEPK